MRIEMQIKGLMVDPITNMPIVILKAADEKSILPIWVGPFEANAIALQIEKVETPRPMTHDLLKEIIGQLQATVNEITVCGLQDNTFYAMVALERDGEEILIDSRPSDAIALALRTGSPIFVEEEVLAKAKSLELDDEEASSEKLRTWLESLDPDDLGQYEM
jgi:bifunctional DNase/RNase